MSQAIKQKLSVSKSKFYVEGVSPSPPLAVDELHDEEKARLLLGDLSTVENKGSKKALTKKQKK